jgi:hypothetical protein
LRSISPAPRATVGQWIRDAGVLAQPVDLRLGGGEQRGARMRVDALAAVGGRAHREHPRQHQHLVGVGAGQHALGQPERIAQHERRRRQRAPAAAAERDVDAHTRARAAGGEPHRLGQQRLVDPARRQRQPAARRLDPHRQRLLLDDAARADRAVDLGAPATEPDPGGRAGAEQHQRRAGHVQRLGVERAGDQQQQEPERRAAERRAHARPPRAPASTRRPRRRPRRARRPRPRGRA